MRNGIHVDFQQVHLEPAEIPITISFKTHEGSYHLISNSKCVEMVCWPYFDSKTLKAFDTSCICIEGKKGE